MQSLNRMSIIGRLGSSPELKKTESGYSVTSFSVATNETWFNKQGEKVEKTEWHDVVCWRELADIVTKFGAKGRLVFVEGPVRSRAWTDKNGVERIKKEVIANTVTFLDPAPRHEAAPAPVDPEWVTGTEAEAVVEAEIIPTAPPAAVETKKSRKK